MLFKRYLFIFGRFHVNGNLLENYVMHFHYFYLGRRDIQGGRERRMSVGDRGRLRGPLHGHGQPILPRRPQVFSSIL